MKTIKHKYVPTVRKNVKIKFKTKTGENVSFKAIKVIKRKGQNL